MMLNFHIITIFPEMFNSYLSESILKKAIKNKKISVKFYNPKDFLKKGKNKKFFDKLDDKPFGGGPGMVLKAEPFLKAIEKAIGRKKKYKIFFLSPRGKSFNTSMAKRIAKNSKIEKNIILVSGRYEGIDSRIQEIFLGQEISVGDYVLTGGELPAMILIDSISRQIDGVLGNSFSLEEERTSARKYYTRPEEIIWKKNGQKKIFSVPKVLLSGYHKKIEEWKKKNK